MTTTINADNVTGGAIVTGDASGQLGLQAAGVTKLTVSSSGVTLATPLPVASGGTGGSATPTAGGIVYGTGTAQAITAAGTSGQYLQSNAGSAPTWSTVSAGFTLATPVATTSGTSIDFTGIPAGVKQIIVTFKGVSTSGSSAKLIQLGDSGGIETTNYFSGSTRITSTTVNETATDSTGFIIASVSSSDTNYGALTLTMENSTTNSWALSGNLTDDPGVTNKMFICSGGKSLSAALDRIRITTLTGSDTFDGGQINIAYI